MSSITLNPEIDELNHLKEFIENILSEKNYQVDLIAEEIFVNIVMYSKTDYITFEAEYDNTTLTLEFIDNGIEFNPLLNEEHKQPKTVEEAEIGGLGIFLTKSIADKLYYQRINNENHLKIIKKVE